MIKWKSIVLVLLLMLTVFIINHPIFGQLRPFQKMEQQQVQLMPGLCIPHPAGPGPKPLELPSMRRTQPMAKLSQQKAMEYFKQAGQAMHVESTTPDFSSAFTLSPSTPVAPGRGYILGMFGAKWVQTGGGGYSGEVNFNQPGDDNHFVQFGFHAKKGFYLLNCDVSGIGGDFNAHIQAALQNLNVSGTSDPQTGIFAFPVNVPQECNVYITFTSPMNNWVWKGCEIIPQS